uniref:Zinc finger FYVE-type containing 19 n=1 Tax=Leptobrachium leishanense TaxID=445787 RepID=A0A8C5MK37_9ANUR
MLIHTAHYCGIYCCGFCDMLIHTAHYCEFYCCGFCDTLIHTAHYCGCSGLCITIPSLSAGLLPLCGMDRRCYGCASKFSLLKRELGCKSCGHSFCSGCLGFSAVLPTRGDAKQRICRKCHEGITRRMAALGAKQSNPGPNPSHVAQDARYRGLQPEDRAVAERLHRLQQETKPKDACSTTDIESRLEALQKDMHRLVPSVQDMEDRLAVLQGMNPPSTAAKPVHKPPDTRTPTQKVNDLLHQLREEVAIDDRWDPDAQTPGAAAPTMNDLSRVDGVDARVAHGAELNAADVEEKNKLLCEAAAELREDNTRAEKVLAIAKRLAVLQGRDPDTVTLQSLTLPDSDEDTDEEAIQRILVQLSEEAVLDEASGFNIPPNNQHRGTGATTATKPAPPQQRKVPAPPAAIDSDDEELPWCCICNANAVLRCHDCNDDLYCKRCFREGHDEFEMKEHRTSSYRKPPKNKSR